jgi:hypothetical protein
MSPQRNWFRRHPVLTVILALLVVGGIASAFSGGKGSNSSGSTASANNASANNVSATAPTPIQGKISGAIQDPSGCLGCGSLVKYISADKIWCGWEGSQLLVHVRFRNDSVEHVTIDWHPSYVIADGGSHGTGLTSIQSIGLDGHTTRVAVAKQSPDGVPAGSAIAQCEPAFSTVSSG